MSRSVYTLLNTKTDTEKRDEAQRQAENQRLPPYDHDHETRKYYRALFKWKSNKQMRSLAARVAARVSSAIPLLPGGANSEGLRTLLGTLKAITQGDVVKFVVEPEPPTRDDAYIQYRTSVLQEDMYNFRLGVLKQVMSVKGQGVDPSVDSNRVAMISTLNAISKRAITGPNDTRQITSLLRREDELVRELQLVESFADPAPDEPSSMVQYMEAYERQLKGLVRSQVEELRRELLPQSTPQPLDVPFDSVLVDWFVDEGVWAAYKPEFLQTHEQLMARVSTVSPAYAWLASAQADLAASNPLKFKHVLSATRYLLHAHLLLIH